MTEIKIKHIDSDEVPLEVGIDSFGWQNISAWSPESPEYLKIHLNIGIGPVGDNSMDWFRLVVCTKPFTDTSTRNLDFNRTIIVEQFDWEEIRKLVIKRVNSCQRATWDESVGELRKKFAWEFEGMQTVAPNKSKQVIKH